NWAYCSAIYQRATGKVPPNAVAIVPGPGGKTLDTYGTINDACQAVTMFHDIAIRAGKYLDDTNWVNAVNTYGKIRNLGSGVYASLTAGKYDVDDTHRLEVYDPTIGSEGNWRALTPLEDITG